MFYFGRSGQAFTDGMEAKLNTYLGNPDKYFSNLVKNDIGRPR